MTLIGSKSHEFVTSREVSEPFLFLLFVMFSCLFSELIMKMLFAKQ